MEKTAVMEIKGSEQRTWVNNFQHVDVASLKLCSRIFYIYIHMHIYIYIYIHMCVCVHISLSLSLSLSGLCARAVPEGKIHGRMQRISTNMQGQNML